MIFKKVFSSNYI